MKKLERRQTLRHGTKSGTGRGLEKWKTGPGGLHQFLEKNAQEVTFLTPLLWLDLCSTLWKNIQYYSMHLWCKGSETNMRFRRKQRGPSHEAARWEAVVSISTQTRGVLNKLEGYFSFDTSEDQLSFLSVFNITPKFLIGKGGVMEMSIHPNSTLFSSDAIFPCCMATALSDAD